eukprot:gene15674-biopygen7109
MMQRELESERGARAPHKAAVGQRLRRARRGGTHAAAPLYISAREAWQARCRMPSHAQGGLRRRHERFDGRPRSTDQPTNQPDRSAPPVDLIGLTGASSEGDSGAPDPADEQVAWRLRSRLSQRRLWPCRVRPARAADTEPAGPHSPRCAHGRRQLPGRARPVEQRPPC